MIDSKLTDANRAPTPNTQHPSPAEALERLRDLVSARTGIIRNVARVGKGLDEPNPPIVCVATLADFDFRRPSDGPRTGSGKGETEAEATLGAIGEAIERYCAWQPDPGAMFKATVGQLGTKAIHPADCVLYAESQYARPGFPYHRFDEGREIAWVRGRELPSGDEIAVPAHFAYLAVIGEREDFLCPPSSNGFAAGPDLEWATLHGLYELIERDAFMLTWLNRLPTRRVDVADLTGLLGLIRDHYARVGVELHVVDVTVDLAAYVMVAVAIDRSGAGPAAVVGLGCSLDPAVAVRKAVLELCQGRPSETTKFRREPPNDRLRSYEDVHTLHDHSAYFGKQETLPELAFLLEGTPMVRLADLPNHATGTPRGDLERCAADLVAAGCRVAYVDVTTPDIVPYGVRVACTIATGLQPIAFGHDLQRLGGRRLYEAPRRLGRPASTEAELNPCPHPLA
jgi:ribosomal protein S12 methylthiotransferase accessory factor